MKLIKNTKIYGLVDPRDQQLRYVGKTCRPINDRMALHIRSANNKRRRWVANWIKKLLDEGHRPEVFVIEEVAPNDDWIEAEIFWIAYFRFLGCRLTNLTLGGEGCSGREISPEVRNKIGVSNRGKKRSPEIRLAMSVARTGKQHKSPTELTKRKIANALRGRPNPAARRKQSAEDRHKKSLAAKRRYADPEQRRRASIIAKKKATEEFKEQFRANLLRSWSDPNIRERRLMAMRTPEYRDAQSRLMKRIWSERKATSLLRAGEQEKVV